MVIINKRRDVWNESKPIRDSLYIEPEPIYIEVDVVREEIMNTFEEIIAVAE